MARTDGTDQGSKAWPLRSPVAAGCGRNGRVYRARDSRLKREVAISRFYREPFDPGGAAESALSSSRELTGYRSTL